MNTQLICSSARSAISAALGLVAVWVVAASFRPTSTFHLAPLLIAGVVPFVYRQRGRSGPGLGVIVGVGLVSAAGLGLAGLDLLRGPSLLPFGDAFVEALVFAPIGAVAGWAIGRLAPSSG